MTSRTVARTIVPVVIALSGGEGDQDHHIEPDINEPYVNLEGQSTEDGADDSDPNLPTETDPDDGPTPSTDYEWLPACPGSFPEDPVVNCANVYTCPSDEETRWALWARELPDGGWYVVETGCFGDEPPAYDGPELGPQVTDATVLHEVRRVGLPAAEVSVQPEDATLVNFDTIFYTDRPVFTRTVTLLGYSVDIEATPSEFLWHHGDGTEQATETPGAPYPEMDVTHQYTDAHVTVHPSVDVTYRVRWRVDDGAWHGIDETLTATGAPTSLRIKEATALLNDPYT